MYEFTHLANRNLEIQKDSGWLAERSDGRAWSVAGSIHGCMRKGECESVAQEDCGSDHSSRQFRGIQEADGQAKHWIERTSNQDA